MEFLAGGSLEEGGDDALVVGVGVDRAWDASGDHLAAALGGWLDSYLDAADFTGKPGQVLSVPAAGAVPFGSVVLVGLGEDPDAEAVRQAAGIAGRSLARTATVATTLHEHPGGAEAVTLGFLLGQYRFDRHLSDPKPAQTTSLRFLGADDSAVAAAGKGAVVAEAVALARDLINESPLHKSPETLAQVARDIGGRTGVAVKVYEEAEIEAEGFGALAGVNYGAANPARMVVLRHEPEGAQAFLAVVGKGIVFDSGGLSLKPPNAMETMKTDMSGAAAVLAAMQAIATLDLPVKVLGIAPITENMPGGAALRPGDVLKARNGKTIEVLNTDAEGRLVLADGLSLAAEEEPDLIVDLATLTGACMVALGDEIAGLLGTGNGPDQVRRAAETAGERVWELPLPGDYRKKIDSEVADMKNVGPRYGGAITAALLLQEFAGEGDWAHLDIAGPARSTEVSGYIGKGGTGFGVRTLVALAEQMAAGG